MSRRTRLVWDEHLLRYDFGAGHPFAPVRLALTERLCRDLGLLEGVEVVGTDVADDDLLATVHTRALIEAVRRGSADPDAQVGHGINTEDTPAFPGMHEAAARVFAGSVGLARALAAGDIDHGVNFAGGLHHASRDASSGFCVYNDCAGAIQALLDAGLERVVYVDTDVHHGDGVEEVFWDEPRVTTVSVHESGTTLFPGTGFPDDVGGRGAEGTAVNVALPAGTGDAGWLRALHSVVRPVVCEVRPQALVSQHGCDTHLLDPQANLRVSVDGQRAAAMMLHDLAHDHSDGRWLAFGGGGYELVDVVPRAWAHLVGIAAHRPVDPDTLVPQSWLEHAGALGGEPLHRRMGDGCDAAFATWESGYDPADPVDRAVLATRKAVFPILGLDPWFD